MTWTIALTLFCSAVVGSCAAGLYLVWPRRMNAEEWILHRRVMDGRVQLVENPGPRWLRWARIENVETRFDRALGLIRVDLRLLRLVGQRSSADQREFIRLLARRAAVGATGGLIAGLAMWAIGGLEGPPLVALPLSLAFGLLLPALLWARTRRRAAEVRDGILDRLSRLMTGVRMLLESGGWTPSEAMAKAVAIYEDPAADVLREAALVTQVRQIELHQALDLVADDLAVDALHRLADAFRVSTRFGTQMANVIVEFSVSLRHAAHAAERERIIRAPVLMIVPAMIFFPIPLLAVILFVVVSPIMSTFSQL